MRQVCSWASYSWDQFFIRQTDSITLENLLFCAASFSHRENRQSSVMAPAYCKASSSQWHGGGWSQCTGTWLHLHDHLRCKITGLGAKRWPLRLFSTVLIVSPSALPGVRSWQYNYCSVGRDKKICCLLSLPPTEHPAALHRLRG